MAFAFDAASARARPRRSCAGRRRSGVPSRAAEPLAEVGAAPLGLGGLGTAPVDQVDRHLVEEPRRRVVRGRPPGGADDRPRDVEPLLGAGHADVREPALLLELGLVAERPGVREDAVLEAGQEHDRELQALGGVQGHQRDHPGVVALGSVGDLVGVGDQRHPLEEVGEAGSDDAGVDVGGVGGRPATGSSENSRATATSSARFSTPGLVLRVVGGLELGEVAGARRAPTRGPRRDARRRRPSTAARSTMPTKPVMALSDRVARPGRPRPRRSASQNVIRSRSASAVTHATARSPMPRLGVLRIRRSEISSAGLTSIRR